MWFFEKVLSLAMREIEPPNPPCVPLMKVLSIWFSLLVNKERAGEIFLRGLFEPVAAMASVKRRKTIGTNGTSFRSQI
jgi:hypothetical protein